MKRFLVVFMLSLCVAFLMPASATASTCTDKQISNLEKKIAKQQIKIDKHQIRYVKATNSYDKKWARHQKNLAKFNLNTLNQSFHVALCVASGGHYLDCIAMAAQAAAKAQKQYAKLQQAGDKINAQYAKQMNKLYLQEDKMVAVLESLQASLAACYQ